MTNTNTSSATAILANLTIKKHYWTIKNFMTPFTLKEWIKEHQFDLNFNDVSETDSIFAVYEDVIDEYRSTPEHRYERNTEISIPLLNEFEAAVFLLALHDYWREKGFNPIPSCNIQNTDHVWRVHRESCEDCRSGEDFMEQLFGKSWTNLPFITKRECNRTVVETYIEYEKLKNYIFS